MHLEQALVLVMLIDMMSLRKHWQCVHQQKSLLRVSSGRGSGAVS